MSKISFFFPIKFSIFAFEKILNILHGQIFIMVAFLYDLIFSFIK